VSGTAQLIEELRRQLELIDDRKADNQRILAGIARSGHTTVVSPDRAVTVLAGPGGTISEVRLAPEAMRCDAVTLSRTITAAIREAVAAGGRPAPPKPTRRPEPPEEDEPYDTVFDV
jgi:hypothetical protein